MDRTKKSRIRLLMESHVPKIEAILRDLELPASDGQPKVWGHTTRRIQRELNQQLETISAGRAEDVVTWVPFNQQLTSYLGSIAGPTGTPYEGGIFNVMIDSHIEGNIYPKKLPRIRFLTPIYHPNIDPDTGEIDSDILGPEWWSPATTIEMILMTISSILDDPQNLDETICQDTAEVFKLDRPLFDEWARQWTREHAMGDGDTGKEPVVVVDESARRDSLEDTSMVDDSNQPHPDLDDWELVEADAAEAESFDMCIR